MAVNVKRYVINYSKFVVQRIPLPIRWTDVIAYANLLTSQIVDVYNRLLLFRDLILYKLIITPQVCKLEKLLNDRYDTVQRRIYIRDGVSYDPLFIYLEVELNPLYLYLESEVTKPGQFIYTEGEVSQLGNDFVVYVPADIVFNLTEMKTRINTFKLPGKYYSIQTF